MKVLCFALGAMRTNTYFISDENGFSCVIDPGMDGEGIAQKLSEKGLRPQYILLTHGHFDHSQSVRYLAMATGAQVCVHREDARMLEDPRINGANLYYRGDFSAYPLYSPQRLLEDGDVIPVGSLELRVIHTPGHTPGSVSYALENYLFCGDTVFHYGYGRYDLWGGDRVELGRSLRRIAALQENYKLCPGHGNSAFLAGNRERLEEEASFLIG